MLMDSYTARVAYFCGICKIEQRGEIVGYSGCMSYSIYCITNKVNGKSYVGKTCDVEYRWKQHVGDALRENPERRYAFQNAIRKYGEDSFFWEIIEEHSTIEEANVAEEFFISYLGTVAPFGYNLTKGGEGESPSYETRKRISETLKRTSSFIGKKGPEHPNFGTKRTPEQNAKHQASCRARAKGKINAELAREIYLDGLNTSLTLPELAAKYPLKKSAITNILHKRTWIMATNDLPDINFDPNNYNSRGSANNRNSISIEDVKAMRAEFAALTNVSQHSFAIANAAKYGLGITGICNILSGRSFARYLT